MRRLQKSLNALIVFLKHHLGRQNEDSSFWILMIAMAALFILGMNWFLDLAELLQEDALLPYDHLIQNWIVGFRDPAYTPVIVFITDLGDRWAYMVVVGIMLSVMFYHRRWWLSGQVFTVGLLSAVATIALKHTYNRQRPSIEHLVEIGGLSFPSGHSLSAMAFYGFVIYLVWRFVKRKWMKIPLTIICLLLILSIGLSRIYLGVHYPSDVAAGFMAGLIWVSFCIIVFNLIELRKKRKKRIQLNSEAPLHE